MARSSFAIIICLMVSFAITNGDRSVCLREPGDQLLLSQPIIELSLFGASNQKNFEGYRITCIETQLPLELNRLITGLTSGLTPGLTSGLTSGLPSGITSKLTSGLTNPLPNLNILQGGVGCDSVNFQIKIGRLFSLEMGVNVYGIKSNDTSCVN